MKFWIIICFYLSLSVSTFAENINWNISQGDFSAKLEFSSSHLKIGDSLIVSIIAKSPEAYEIDAEALKKEIIESVNLVYKNAEISQEIISPDHIRYKIHFLITGQYVLNLLTIPFKPKQGQQGGAITLLANVFPIEIEDTYTSKKPIQNYTVDSLPLSLRPPIAMSPENRAQREGPDRIIQEAARNKRLFNEKVFPFIPVFGSLALLVVAYFLWRPLLIRIKSTLKKFQKKPQPKQDALRALLELAMQQKMAPDARFIGVSDVLCGYIGEQYQIPVHSETSNEFLMEIIQKSLFKGTSQLLLKEFLRSSDLVKFGHYTPSEQDVKYALQAAQQFITNN